MINAALRWLREYKREISKNKELLIEVAMYMNEYQLLKKQFEGRILYHDGQKIHNEELELTENLSLLTQVIAVERAELEKLWRANKINLKARNKLANILDHQMQRYLI